MSGRGRVARCDSERDLFAATNIYDPCASFLFGAFRR